MQGCARPIPAALERGELAEAVSLADETRPFAAREHDFLRLDARIAMTAGDSERAAAIMSDLRQRAGEAWRAEDELMLAGNAPVIAQMPCPPTLAFRQSIAMSMVCTTTR